MEKTGRQYGAVGLPNGSIRWRVWAPHAEKVQLVLQSLHGERLIDMKAEGDGVYTHIEALIEEGQRYFYRLDGGEGRQDPCSLWQPDGVPGPSAVVRPETFQWSDHHWRGVALRDLVIYELHVGTFTVEGTFEAVIPRLRELRELGVTALEIMPIGQFPGTRNWGYDGVLPYATQNSYGGPYGFQKLVNAAHREGLAVILDVIYNHLGPEASYVRDFGPYFTDKHKTPWGDGINYDDRSSDFVRAWVLDNVRMWLEEFHLDGLRLDAVHAILDTGPRHILQAINDVSDVIAHERGYRPHIIAESDQNDPRILLPVDRGGHGFGAQWADDFHHAVHAYLSGEHSGYYSDYGQAEDIAKAFRSPFIYAGHYSRHRGRKHGAPVPATLTGERFIAAVQNHDQVGNRAKGDRLTTILTSPSQRRLAACLMLFAPYLPLIFMGEEYGETNPFPFFCSFSDPELTRAVRDGRRREFADFVSDPNEVPDPSAVQTYAAARLSWSWPEGTERAGMRCLYHDVLAARRNRPALSDYVNRASRILPVTGTEILELIRGGTVLGAEESIQILFNLSNKTVERVENHPDHHIIFSSEARRYGGARSVAAKQAQLLPFECVVYGPSAWAEL